MDTPTYFFDKTLIFRQIPLFAGLNFFERRLVLDSLQIAEYKQSEIIYRQGDPPDAFYFIITGRVQIFIEKDNKEETLEIIHRSKYFGFISLLTGEAHSVSARAVNDTIVAKIPKENFESILKHIPRLAIDFSQKLSRRLKRRDLHPKSIFESTIISIFGEEHLRFAASAYAVNLALGLKYQTNKKVVLVQVLDDGFEIGQRLGNIDARVHIDQKLFYDTETVFKKIIQHPSGIDVLLIRNIPEAPSWAPFLISVLTMLVNDYHYCLVPLLLSFGPEVFKILSQADVVHWIVTKDPAVLKELSTMRESGFWTDDSLKKKVKLIVEDEKASLGQSQRLSIEEQSAIFPQPIFATLPAIEDPTYLINKDFGDSYSKTIRRIARQVGEIFVGLALGSGSALGLAHIGVLKALEKEDIPIDIVSGCSMGALIGALWCVGYSAQEVEEIILANKDKPYLFGWNDLTFPLHGLIQGNYIRAFLNKYLKDKTFYDIQRPLKIVACDCLTMRQVVFDSGRLIDAVMASVSIPGVFQPYKIADHYYIDGGILNPLPTDVLVDAGARKIIAVNVLPSPEEIERTRELITKRALLEAARRSPFKKAVSLIQHKQEGFLKPNIFDVIVSSVQSMEYALAQLSSLSQSDVTLHPDMTAMFWSAFDHAPDLIKRGEEETLLHLSQIKELVARSE